MSSDILSRRIDFNRFDMIWAGIQKNLGAAGMALTILKKDFAKRRVPISPLSFNTKHLLKKIPPTIRRRYSAFTH